MNEASEAMADEPAESLERLEARICSGAADLTAAEAHWLLDVAEFDRREGWAHWGLPTCAAWLSWQVGLDPRAAREKVRVARALVEFPIFAAAIKTGVLTYSKARAITRIADHDTAEELLELAVAATSNQLERFVAAVRRADPDLQAQELEADDQRSLTSSTVGGVTEIVLRLPVEPGQAVLAAIEAFLPTDREASPAQRRADAIVALAEHAIARSGDEPTDEPRYLATLHLHPDDLDALRPTAADRTAGFGCCVASGDRPASQAHAMPTESARRMLCDAAIEGLVHDRRGDPMRLGRASRVVRRRLKRALRHRDGGCRFPGCTHRGWLDAHHIVHWVDGGPTDLENLLLLCRRHHRMVHELNWAIVVRSGGGVVFRRPDGVEVAAIPPVRHGDAGGVRRHDRSAEDGRCRWAGDGLDLHYAVSNHLENRDLRRERARAS